MTLHLEIHGEAIDIVFLVILLAIACYGIYKIHEVSKL